MCQAHVYDLLVKNRSFTQLVCQSEIPEVDGSGIPVFIWELFN